MTRSITFAVLALALSASPALAANVEVKEGSNRMEAVYTAAPGETNDVLVSHVDDYTLRLEDAGATITAGPGCRLLSTHAAECSNPDGSSQFSYLYAARVLAGDGNDTVRSSNAVVPGIAGPTALRGPQLAADGGPGTDLLVGSASGDDLNGGGGAGDKLIGNGNNDNLTDGDTTGAADADEIDGGDDGDTVSYAARTASVKVLLGNESGKGEGTEGDVVKSVEHATGGSANDLLGGTDGTNFLTGGPGDDRIVAGAGDDQLQGGKGRDRMYGQTGNDGLSGDADGDLLIGGSGSDGLAGGGGADSLDCGPGSDTGIDPAGPDFLYRECENVNFNYAYEGGTTLLAAAHPVAARHGYLTFLIGCPHPEVRDGECDVAYGTLRIHDTRGRLMGSGTLTKSAGRRSARTEKPARVVVKLNGHGRYRIARRDGTGAVISLKGHALPTASWGAGLAQVR